MAWNDAYGTAEEYRARVGKSDAADDADIGEQLIAVSGLLNRECHRQFNLSGEVARQFTRTSPIAVAVTDLVTLSADGFTVDTTGDGVFETTIDSGDLILLPRMAAEDPDPYTRIELHRKQTTITQLPRTRYCIQITGTWGWAAVPNAIVEAVYSIVREIRDLQEGGYTATLENVDIAIRLSANAPLIVRRIVRQFGRASGVM